MRYWNKYLKRKRYKKTITKVISLSKILSNNHCKNLPQCSAFLLNIFPFYLKTACLFGPNSSCLFFFFFSKIFHQPFDIMVSYHHVQYQKKLMIQSWENLVTAGRWTDKLTDRQTDKSDFIGCCPTNIEHPIATGTEIKTERINWYNQRLKMQKVFAL